MWATCPAKKVYDSTKDATATSVANNDFATNCCKAEVDCPYVPTPKPTARPTPAPGGGGSTGNTTKDPVSAAPRAAAAGIAGLLASVMSGFF